MPRGYVYDMIYHTPASMITRFHNHYSFVKDRYVQSVNIYSSGRHA
jgi:hypothetical protein